MHNQDMPYKMMYIVQREQVGVVGALSAFFNDSLDLHSAESRELACTRMVGQRWGGRKLV